MTTNILSTAKGYKYLVAVREGMRMLNAVSQVSKLDTDELRKVLSPLKGSNHADIINAMCNAFDNRNYELYVGLAELEAIYEEFLPFETRHNHLQAVQKAIRLLNQTSCYGSNTDELRKILKPLENTEHSAVCTAICDGFDEGSYDTTYTIAELEEIREDLL